MEVKGALPQTSPGIFFLGSSGAIKILNDHL